MIRKQRFPFLENGNVNTLAISSIGSIAPCGKQGADATSYQRENWRRGISEKCPTKHVFLFIARRIFVRSISCVCGSSGTRRNFIFRYEQAWKDIFFYQEMKRSKSTYFVKCRMCCYRHDTTNDFKEKYAISSWFFFSNDISNTRFCY